jgi:hypothetical protein
VLSSWKVTRAQFDAIVSATKDFGEDSLQFMSKVLHRSGLGDETYAPPSECQEMRDDIMAYDVMGCMTSSWDDIVMG